MVRESLVDECLLYGFMGVYKCLVDECLVDESS